MFKPRDNIGSDAVARPHRNIFAPPAGTPHPSRVHTGRVFDAAAACDPETLTGTVDGRVASAAVFSRRGATRRSGLVALGAWLIAGATAVALAVVLLGGSGHHAATRRAPMQRPAHARPRQHRTDGSREDRGRVAPARRPRPPRRRTDRPRPRLPRRPQPVTTPRPRLVAPPAPKRAPVPGLAHPRAMPGPTRVPPASQPEFM